MISGETGMNELPVRGDTLAEQIYRQLTAEILSGSFAPMDRINIRHYADGMGVSVTPVREAIQRLVSEGVLDATDKNTIVVPERDEFEIKEIFDIRRDLEGEMAAKAATELTRADDLFLKQTHAGYLEALDRENYKEALRLNSIFHFHIYRHADMPVRLKIAESLWLRIGPTLRHMYPTLQRDRSDHKRHETIIECASHRDAKGLRAAIIADLDSSQSALHQYVRDHKSEYRLPNATRRTR